MEGHLYQELGRAAHFLREGNHRGAEGIIRALQAIRDPLSLEYIVRLLMRDVREPKDDSTTYMHFAAFRILRVFLSCNRESLGNKRRDILTFFMDYVESSGARLLTPAWRSVLSEAALDAAIVLKFSCAMFEDAVDEAVVSEVVSEVLSLLDNRKSELQVVFVRQIVLHVIEEFGLYHQASLGRGMPMKFHRACRSALERDGLARLLSMLLCCAASAVAETLQTLEVLFACLSALLSWSLHDFFEEDASDNECNHCFRVSGFLWTTLLFHGVSLPNGVIKIDAMLHTWYTDGSVCGLLFSRRQIVGLITQFCGVVVEPREFASLVNYGDRFLSLACFVTRDLLGHAEHDIENARAILPLAISGISSIVTNLSEIFGVGGRIDSCISELSLFAKTIITMKNRLPEYEDDDSILAALDSVLSCLFKVAGMASFHGSNTTGVLASEGLEVLNAFLEAQLSCTHSSEDTQPFSDAFIVSHASLLGHIGRWNPERSAESFCLALGFLCQRYSEKREQTEAEHLQIQEGLWLILKIVGAFLADACEGEDVVIPPCFVADTWTESHPVLMVVMALMKLMEVVMQQLSLASPAVVSVILEVLGTFIAVYVVRQERGKFSFTQGSTTIVSWALYSLRVFPFDGDVALAGCRVLDVCMRSTDIASALQSCELLQTAEEMITCGQHFYGNVRGRITAFWVGCVSQDTLSERLVSILHTFDVRVTESLSVDVGQCLERCTSLGGFFVSLKESKRLVSCCDIVMSLCDHVLSVSTTRFYEKELTIQSADMILQLFISYSAVLNGLQMVWLVEKVCTTLNFVVKALCSDATWRAETALEEKHRLMQVLSYLLCEVSRWSMMECDLPGDTIQPLGAYIISSLACFVSLFDERCLTTPELQESLINAFQLCSDAFTGEFVAYSGSQVFLSTLIFLLNSESTEVQRAGITVTTRVVTFLRDSDSENTDLFSCLLSTVLQGLVSGRLTSSSSSQMARAITALCSSLPPDRIELALAEAAQQSPMSDVSHALRKVISLARDCLVCAGGDQHVAMRSLADSITESLNSIRGVLLV